MNTIVRELSGNPSPSARERGARFSWHCRGSTPNPPHILCDSFEPGALPAPCTDGGRHIWAGNRGASLGKGTPHAVPQEPLFSPVLSGQTTLS